MCEASDPNHTEVDDEGQGEEQTLPQQSLPDLFGRSIRLKYRAVFLEDLPVLTEGHDI